MGNWSINPNTLASIDDNGKATFQEHTQDTDYTITYNDGTSGDITKTFTVYACGQPPVDCSVYEFSTMKTPLKTHTSTSIANSLRSLEALTYTIKSSGGFLTGITVVGTSDRWEYMGEFNRTESLYYDRTATIEYKNGDGTCVFQQQLVMKGNEEYTVLVTSDSSESSCAKVLIADGGDIEFTLRFNIGHDYTLTYLVKNGEKFGEAKENFGNIIVPFGDVSSFRFDYLSTNEGNILKASTSSNGTRLPELTTTTWMIGNSRAMLDRVIPPLCDDSSSNGNRFVVSWDIDTANKTITIYYKYEFLVG